MATRIGVAGTGRLGREHVRVLAGLDGVDFVACHDTNASCMREVAAANNATPFDTLDAMFDSVDAVSIVVPTTDHYSIAMRAIGKGLDVFVEKPVAASVAEAEEMLGAARLRGRILQVGHVERFNGAVEAVANRLGKPSFIEIHRLAPFTLRGTEVSVVGDLMIHDLDLLGYFLKEEPVDIRAKGASILTSSPDIVNVRLEYPSGCVANVTASRVTIAPMRKVRVFSPESYVSIDLLKGEASCYRKADGFEERVASLPDARVGGMAALLNLTDFIEIETVKPDRVEPLRKELDAFRHSVTTRALPPVTGEDGLSAVRLATQILNQMEQDAAS